MALYDSMILNSHTIISGSTGSGKSVFINNFLYYLIRDAPQDSFELWIIDPKRVDYIEYRPLCSEYATDIASAEKLLAKAVNRMEYRYKYLEKHKEKQWRGSHIFILIDEFGQVLRSKKAVNLLDELLRLGRAARIHVIAANQSASRATGCPAHLRVNFTVQIGLHCVDRIASRQAIGVNGCENLPLYGYCYKFAPQDIQPELYKIEPIPEKEIMQLLKSKQK